MNNSVKIAVTAGASFVAGYFVANWRNEKFYFDRANEEAQVVREEYEAKLADLKKMDEAAEALSSYQGNGGFEPVDVHAVAETIQYSDYNTEEAEKLQPREVESKTDYAAKSAPSPKADPKHAVPKSASEVITEDEYIENGPEHEQIYLIYYAGDDTLTNFDNQVVPKDIREQIIGNIPVQKESFWTSEPKVVVTASDGSEKALHVRNAEMGHDYEIACVAYGFKDAQESPGENG